MMMMVGGSVPYRILRSGDGSAVRRTMFAGEQFVLSQPHKISECMFYFKDKSSVKSLLSSNDIF